MPYSNTSYPWACRTINYPRRPEPPWIVRPGQCMACHLNRTRLTTAMHSIPTIRSRTISPPGVDSISPPSGVGSGCSRLMDCIDCCTNPDFRIPSWSWKGRAAGTCPIFLSPRSMSWPPMIRAVIGAWIIPTGKRGSGVWHDHCAHVRACQMSGWLRRQTNILPTLFQVNAQRVLWQRRCDRLMDYLLCNYCKEEKDEAFARGQGLDWIPDNCNECRTVRGIFEQTVTCREWQTPRLYADDEPHTMWAWNPLSHHKHCF